MDRTLHGWATEFSDINKNWLGMFEANVISDYKRIDAYGLPTYKKCFYEVELLMKDINTFICKFDYTNCYIQLYPKISTLKKYSKMGITDPIEIITFIEEKVSSLYKNYFILISEFETNKYGGSIMSDGRKLYLEMCEGLQNQIAYGTTSVKCCTISNLNRKSFSNTSDHEKCIMENVISYLELNSTLSQDKFLKGYFEFAITTDQDGKKSRIVFFDFKDDKTYYNI
jgi:hypothetical protein